MSEIVEEVVDTTITTPLKYVGGSWFFNSNGKIKTEWKLGAYAVGSYVAYNAYKQTNQVQEVNDKVMELLNEARKSLTVWNIDFSNLFEGTKSTKPEDSEISMGGDIFAM